MSSKIFKSINSYKLIEDIDPGRIEYLECVLKDTTKKRIEEGNLHLHILAVIFKVAMNEAKNDYDIDRIVNQKLEGRDYIIGLAQNLDDVNF